MLVVHTTLIFQSLILITGGLTIFTDLTKKKIYNQHLVLGAVLGIIAIAYTSFFKHEPVLFHIVNGLVAFLIGFFLHRFALWKGGDAKLFALYALLMPALEPGHILLSSVVNLFACSFIVGSAILTPIFIKDIITNKLLSPQRLQDMVRAIAATLLFSWVLFPVYYFTKTTLNPIISLTVTYLIFNLAHRIVSNIRSMKRNYTIEILGLIFGFLIRFWLAPNYLSGQALTYFILRTGLWSTVSAFIYTTLDHLEESRDRVPFAPLLFTGCVLCYTPFLTWIMHLVH